MTNRSFPYGKFLLAAIFSGYFIPSLSFCEMSELPFPEVKCRDELLTVLAEWHVTGKWKAQPVVTSGQPVFAAATDTVGTWVQIQLMPENTVFAAKITAHSQTGIDWTASQGNGLALRRFASTPASETETRPVCQATLHKAAKEVFANSSREEFTDADLKSIFKKNKDGGIILVWSPGMAYSIRAVAAAVEAAKTLHLPIDIILDSEASLASATNALQKAGLDGKYLRSNHSLELYMRGMQQHFPSMQVYKNGSFSRPLLPGLMTAQGYTDYIKGEL
jgi:hypothetical protein